MSRLAIIVIGSINTDLVIRGARIPAAGETVLGGTFYQAGGGKGANQAVAAARASKIPVSLVAAVGDDDFGRGALAGLRADGVDCQHVKTVEGMPSGVALILVDQSGQNCISVASGANLQLAPTDIDALPDELFAQAQVLLACLEAPWPTVLRALERARRFGLTTVLNPAPAALEILRGGALSLVDIITPNESEAALLAGGPVEDVASAVAAGEQLRKKGCREVVLTLGARGCVVVSQRVTHVPPVRVRAVDATAAGDAFNGVLAVALAEGQDLLAAARLATAAAGLSVTRQGAQPSLPRRPEIETLAAKQTALEKDGLER